jgi:hypothetical protein
LERTALLPEVAAVQRQAAAALRRAQAAVVRQVVIGIGETIGRLAFPSADGRGVVVDLPVGSELALAARAMTAENVVAEVIVEAGRDWLMVVVAPWYGVEEIDHTILVVAKVAHVLLGLHPATMDEASHAACGLHDRSAGERQGGE